MSVLEATFEKFLTLSKDYSDFKKSFQTLFESTHELAKAITNIAHTLQAHQTVIGELLLAQKTVIKTINDLTGVQDPLEDPNNLN
jgi:hypothetical protein